LAHINKVWKSIETSDGSHCVDFFERPEQTFGFEEYRRDAEDLSGWFVIGNFSSRIFINKIDTIEVASILIPWIVARIKRDR